MDNNPQATQDANAAYFASNPNVFGGKAAPTPTATAPTTPQTAQTTNPTTQATQPNPQTPGLQMPTGDLSAAQQAPKFDAQGMLIPGTGGLSGQGYLAAKNDGQPVPQDSSSASQAVAKYTPPPPPNTSALDAQLANDPGYQQLLSDQKLYNDTATQQGTLTDEYAKLSDAAGIPSLNTELMNMKNVIDGTETDIRKEVQAAGGMATDSQVMALSAARNKTLIKNYNNLEQTLTNAQNHVDTMIGLAKEDKANALNAITQKLNIDQQINQYRDKMTSAAQEGYNNVIQAVGYTGLLQSLGTDPSSIALAEKTLGLQPGGLTQLVNAQKSQANAALAQSANITSRFTNNGGEIFDTKTGQAYSNSTDFLKAAGVSSFAEAYSKGLVTDVNTSGVAYKDLPASAQEYQYAVQNGYKGTYEDYQNEDANRKRSVSTTNNITYGQGQDQILQADVAQTNKNLKSEAGSTGFVSPDTWKRAENDWLNAGHSAKDFIDNFSGLIDRSDPNAEANYGIKL